MRLNKRDMIGRNDTMSRGVITAIRFGIRTVTNKNALERAGAKFRVVSINMYESATTNLANVAKGGRKTVPSFVGADTARERGRGGPVCEVTRGDVQFIPAVLRNLCGDVHSAKVGAMGTLDLSVLSRGLRGSPLEMNTQLGADGLDLLCDTFAIVHDDAANRATLRTTSDEEGSKC